MSNEKRLFSKWRLIWVWGIIAFVANASLLWTAAPTEDDLGASEEKIEYRQKVYFAWNDGITGEELWVWDIANGQNPALYKNIRSGSASSSPHEFIVYNDKAYFVANDGIHGAEIWVIDGESSPMLAYDFPGNTWNPRNLLVWENQEKIYFINSQVFDTGTTVYSYDGVNPPVSAPFISNNPGYWPTDQLIDNGLYLHLVRNNIGQNPNYWNYDGESPPVLDTDGEYIEVPEEHSGGETSITTQTAPSSGILSLNYGKFVVSPNIQGLRPTSAWMCWRTNLGSLTIHVTLGTDPFLTENRRDYELTTGINQYSYNLQLPDLHSGKYWYYNVRIVNSSEEIKFGHFRTPVADGDRTPRRIVIVGDNRGPSVTEKYGDTARIQVNNAIYRENPDLIINLGDMAVTSFNCHDHIADFFSYFGGNWGMLSQAAWMPTMGNHEFLKTYAMCSRVHFVLPPIMYLCFSLSCTVFDDYLYNQNERYYRYDFQNIRFLNLFIPYDGSWLSVAPSYYRAGTAQYNWIANELDIAQQDLASGRIDFVIPIFHHPMVRIDSFPKPIYKPAYGPYVDMFRQHGVQVVITACEHNYQHFYFYDKPELEFYITGGGGAKLDSTSEAYYRNIWNGADQSYFVGKLISAKKQFNYLVLTSGGTTDGKPSITITRSDVEKTGTYTYNWKRNQDSRVIVKK